MVDIFKNFDGSYSNLDDISIYSEEDQKLGHFDLRIKIMNQLGFAIFYMKYLNNPWDRKQEDRVEKLCREFVAQKQYVQENIETNEEKKMFYLKFLWKVTDETENMC